MRDLIVLGGGITGLAAAYLAARLGARSPWAGSVARSRADCSAPFPSVGTGWSATTITFSRMTWSFAGCFRNWASRTNWIFFQPPWGSFVRGRPTPSMASRTFSKFRPLGLLDKLRFGLSSAYLGKIADWRPQQNESAQAWFRRHAGPTAASEAIWNPLLNIKFGHLCRSGARSVDGGPPEAAHEFPGTRRGKIGLCAWQPERRPGAAACQKP